MTTRVVVLGGGMVGSVMAGDLATDPTFRVTVADRHPTVLADLERRLGIATVVADLADPATVTALVADYDLAVGALASTLGFKVLRAVIEAGTPYVDISFMAEDATTLDALAVERGVCCVVDCGVAPGVSNMMVGFAAAQLDPCESVAIYVGGLPVVRRWPYEYQAGFAPHDVIEEYTRPARLVVGGELVIREALSEPELMDFPGIGTLEAFNTDGLRSLIHTLAGVPEMKEKTLRYPGHIELMRVLRHTGFFSTEPVTLAGQDVRPLDLTAALLFPKWTYAPGEADLTVMRVEVCGKAPASGQPLRYGWELLDRADGVTGLRSMSRTTAFPATIMARMLRDGRWCRPGVHPPEIPAREPGLLETMLRELQARGVSYQARVETSV